MMLYRMHRTFPAQLQRHGFLIFMTTVQILLCMFIVFLTQRYVNHQDSAAQQLGQSLILSRPGFPNIIKTICFAAGLAFITSQIYSFTYHRLTLAAGALSLILVSPTVYFSSLVPAVSPLTNTYANGQSGLNLACELQAKTPDSSALLLRSSEQSQLRSALSSSGIACPEHP